MNRAEAEKFIGNPVLVQSGANGSYIGELVKVVPKPERPWCGQVKIRAVIRYPVQAVIFGDYLKTRRPLPEAVINEFDGSEISKYKGEIPGYPKSCYRALHNSIKDLADQILQLKVSNRNYKVHLDKLKELCKHKKLLKRQETGDFKIDYLFADDASFTYLAYRWELSELLRFGITNNTQRSCFNFMEHGICCIPTGASLALANAVGMMREGIGWYNLPDCLAREMGFKDIIELDAACQQNGVPDLGQYIYAIEFKYTGDYFMANGVKDLYDFKNNILLPVKHIPVEKNVTVKSINELRK